MSRPDKDEKAEAFLNYKLGLKHDRRTDYYMRCRHLEHQIEVGQRTLREFYAITGEQLKIIDRLRNALVEMMVKNDIMTEAKARDYAASIIHGGYKHGRQDEPKQGRQD